MSTSTHDWRLVYDASVAGKLSEVFQGSSGTQNGIGIEGVTGIAMKFTGYSAAADGIRLTPVILDGRDPATANHTHPVKADGLSPDYKTLKADDKELPAFSVSGKWFTVEPWLPTADLTAVCQVWIRLLY